jgi:tetratricopeptide (TPR) repeat protein
MRRVLAIDPLDRRAHNALAYSYASTGQMDQALQSLNEYIRLAPTDANSFDTQGDLYGRSGEREKAMQSYSTAVRIDSSFSMTWCKMGYLHLLEGNEAGARACWNRVLEIGDPAFCAAARLYTALVPLYHGQTTAAVRALTEAIAGDEAAGYRDWFLAAKWFFLGCVQAERGEWTAADASFTRMKPPFDRDPCLFGLRTAILAELDAPRAERDVAVLVTLPDHYGVHDIAKCWLRMAEGRHAEACDAIDGSRSEGLRASKNYTKGLAYLRTGRIPQSIAWLEIGRDAFPDTDRLVFVPTWMVRVHYYLGQAYEANGEREKAVQEYERFVDRWKDADPVFAAQVRDARERLKRLRA